MAGFASPEHAFVTGLVSGDIAMMPREFPGTILGYEPLLDEEGNYTNEVRIRTSGRSYRVLVVEESSYQVEED